MSKELEALENIKREAGIPYFSTLYDIDDWKEDLDIIEKSLKALEIIKERVLEIDDFHKLIKCKDSIMLTMEEYELLKEVLK